MTEPEHPKPRLSDVVVENIGDAPLVTVTASPASVHAVMALEGMFMAKQMKAHGKANHRSNAYATSSILHSFFALESLTNLIAYLTLKKKDSPIFLHEADRSKVDKDAKKRLDSPSADVWDSLDYLLSERVDCDNWSTFGPQVKHLNTLRNALVHGYAFERDMLLDPKVSASRSKDRVMVAFSLDVADTESHHSGFGSRWTEKMEAIGVRHDPDQLCEHDASVCVFLCFQICEELTSHFGPSLSAKFKTQGKNYHYTSSRNHQRDSKTSTHPTLAGVLELFQGGGQDRPSRVGGGGYRNGQRRKKRRG